MAYRLTVALVITLCVVGGWRVLAMTASPGGAGVPSVKGEIERVISSPGLDRAALLIRTTQAVDSGCFDQVAFYNRAGHKLITADQLGARFYCQDASWSSDGKSLAAWGEKGVTLVSDAGKVRRPSISQPVLTLLWREDYPKRFLYLSSDPGAVWEYDTDTGAELSYRIDGDPVSLSNAKGKPCLSYFKRTDAVDRKARHDTLLVIGLEDRTPVMSLPLQNLASWDSFGLTMSPDGRYFFLWAGASGERVNIVARTADAQTLLSQPTEAVMYQSTAEDVFNIAWAPSEFGGADGPAIVNPEFDSPFLLDLTNGSRDSGTYAFWGLEGTRRLDFWSEDSGKPGPSPSLLMVTKDGLDQPNMNGNHDRFRLLVRHKPID